MNEQIENPVENSGASPEVIVAQNTPIQSPVQAPVVESLPENIIDKTKEQFQKLLDSNRRLNEANMALTQQIQQNNNQQIPQTVTKDEDVNSSDFIDKDPTTGERYFNEQKFAAKMADIQRKQQEIADKASQTESTIQGYLKVTENREVERQEKETFSAYPELNPKTDKFDSVFSKQVRGVLIDSFQNPIDYDDSRPLTFKEAADFVRQAQGKTTQVDAQAEQAQIETASQNAQQLKEQATQVPSQPRAEQAMVDSEELDNLKYRTRFLNDDSALAERLKHTAHILPKEPTS